MEKKHVNLMAKTFMTFAIAFVIALIGKLPAEAAAPSNVKQVDVYNVDKEADPSSSMALTWSPISGVTEYNVQVSTPAGTPIGTATVNQNVALINRLQPGQSYQVAVSAAGETSAPIEAVTAPAMPTEVNHTGSGEKTISLRWSTSAGASGYAVEYVRADSSTGWNSSRTQSATSNNTTLKNLSKNTEYYVAVYAVRKSSSGFEAWSLGKVKKNLPVKPSKVSGVMTEYQYTSQTSYSKSNKLLVGLKKSVASADGYQYDVYTAGKGKSKKIASITTKTSSSLKEISKSKLKDNRFIKVRMRAYCKVGSKKVWGSWSDWKYTCQSPKINKKKTTTTASGVKTSWDKVDGANRYVVYVAIGSGSYKKVGTTTKTSMEIRNSALHSSRSFSIRVVAQKKVKGKYVSGEDTWGLELYY